MSALILAYDGTLQFPDGSPACDIGVELSNVGLTILGDNFLRSACAVYDIDAKQIGLAQAKPNAPAGSSISRYRPMAFLAPQELPPSYPSLHNHVRQHRQRLDHQRALQVKQLPHAPQRPRVRCHEVL